MEVLVVEEERQQLVSELINSYEAYKKANTEYWNNTYYDENGEFQIFGNIKVASIIRKIETAREQYNSAEFALEKWDRNHNRK